MTDTRITKEKTEKLITLLRKYQRETITLKEYLELVPIIRETSLNIVYEDNPFIVSDEKWGNKRG